MYEFLWPSAHVHYKPGASFEKPLPVPEPVAVVLWPWLPAVPAHPLDTSVLLAHAGKDAEQKPTEIRGPAAASGSTRDQIYDNNEIK